MLTKRLSISQEQTPFSTHKNRHAHFPISVPEIQKKRKRETERGPVAKKNEVRALNPNIQPQPLSTPTSIAQLQDQGV